MVAIFNFKYIRGLLVIGTENYGKCSKACLINNFARPRRLRFLVPDLALTDREFKIQNGQHKTREIKVG